MENEPRIIKMSLNDLRRLLWQQQEACAKYITRNLSVYGEEWISFPKDMREKMIEETKKSPFAEDFKILEKYIKE